MTATEQLYYTRLRQQQVYRAYAARQQYLQQRIANIRYAIACGVDVMNIPEYRNDILMIETEYGRGLFVFEDNDRKILVREENRKWTT